MSELRTRKAARSRAGVEPVLELREIRRVYHQADAELPVLGAVSLSLYPGEIVALVGPSGAGKSTLLHMAGLLERPDAGEVLIDGRSCGRMGDKERTAIRRKTLGYVYQFHHLLPEFSALENVMLPQMLAGVSQGRARDHARGLLALVGLKDRETHRPARLSGGEQQRVAIVRALANDPRVLLGDEPTGNLDQQTGLEVMSALIGIVREVGLSALIATHNLELARRMDRIVALHNGELAEV